MANFLFTAMIADDRKPGTCSAVSARDVTPLEIQRWEDDGGAVLPDAMPRKQRSLRCVGSDFTPQSSLAA